MLAGAHDRAAVGLVEPGEQPHERRLPGAVRADQADPLAVADDAGDAREDLLRAVMPLQSGEPNELHSCRRTFTLHATRTNRAVFSRPGVRGRPGCSPLVLACWPCRSVPFRRPAPAASVEPTPTPQRMLGLIRAQFRSHRPPPPLETYTITRAQKATNGYPDFANSYTVHVWVRNLDRAALDAAGLSRRGARAADVRPAGLQRGARSRPADRRRFEPAPARPHPVSEVPTPEPNYTPLPVIGGVRTIIESDYRVDSLEVEGDELHLHIFPIRDVERNRLREIFCDKKTLELHKLIATDKLFIGPTASLSGNVHDYDGRRSGLSGRDQPARRGRRRVQRRRTRRSTSPSPTSRFRRPCPTGTSTPGSTRST